MTESEIAYVNVIQQGLYRLLSKYHYIVSIDPGENTGVFKVHNSEFNLDDLQVRFDSIVFNQKDTTWTDFLKEVLTDEQENDQDKTRRGLIIYENFRKRTRQAIATSNKECLEERFIGGIQYIVSSTLYFDYVKVEPSTHKSFSSDFKLNILKSIVNQATGEEFRTQHQKDALSLFLYVLGNQHKINNPLN